MKEATRDTGREQSFVEVDEDDVRGALMIRKLLSGGHRFNDIQRSAPLMFPALLAKRLKTLQLYTIIDQRVLLGKVLTNTTSPRQARS